MFRRAHALLTKPFWDPFVAATKPCGTGLMQIHELAKRNVVIDKVLLGGAVVDLVDLVDLIEIYPAILNSAKGPLEHTLSGIRDANNSRIDQLLGACGSRR